MCSDVDFAGVPRPKTKGPGGLDGGLQLGLQLVLARTDRIGSEGFWTPQKVPIACFLLSAPTNDENRSGQHVVASDDSCILCHIESRVLETPAKKNLKEPHSAQHHTITHTDCRMGPCPAYSGLIEM